MGIDRQQLQSQLKSLEVQEQHTIGQLHEIRGAQRQCRHFLGQLERQEAETAPEPPESAALVE